jgi:hypothetical protein
MFATDLPRLVHSLELETDAGKVNLATIALLLAGFGAAQIMSALGAIIDRFIYVIFYRKQRPPPNLRLQPFVNHRHLMKEARFIALIAGLCVAGLIIAL